MHVCRYVHVFECVFCEWVVERVWVYVSVSVCLGVNVCGPMYEEERVLGNLRPHATYCSFLSEPQHLQARYERKKKSSVTPPGLEPGTLLFASNALTD